MKPIRIIMVVRLFHPWVGGAEKQAAKLAKKLLEKGIEVRVVTGWWFRGTRQRDVVDGVSVFRNHTLWHGFDIKGLRKLSGFIYILTLWWYLWRKRSEYDLIHIHSLSYHTFAAVVAGKCLKRGSITKLANSGVASDILKMRQNKHLPLTRFMMPAAFRCDRLVATNPTIARELSAAGVPKERIVRLTNGVENDIQSHKADYAIESPTRLLFVGRLHEQKGVDVLLEAFQHLVKRFPDKDLRLDLLGDGPLRKDLESLAVELGIAQQVDFVGQCDTVSRYLRSADIFVLPSRAEGISNALLEAMACGLPVVASRIPGNVDVVCDRRNGLLFAANQAESLFEAVSELLTDAQLRAQLGTEARRTVEAEFSLDSVSDRYIALYRELLGDTQWHDHQEAQRKPAGTAVQV